MRQDLSWNKIALAMLLSATTAATALAQGNNGITEKNHTARWRDGFRR